MDRAITLLCMYQETRVLLNNSRPFLCCSRLSYTVIYHLIISLRSWNYSVLVHTYLLFKKRIVFLYMIQPNLTRRNVDFEHLQLMFTIQQQFPNHAFKEKMEKRDVIIALCPTLIVGFTRRKFLEHFRSFKIVPNK